MPDRSGSAMGEKISIAVEIAGRTYPVSVPESDRELVLAAKEKIAETYNKYKTQFASLERSDLLSMVVLEMVTEQLRKETKSNEKLSEAVKAGEELSQLHTVLDKYLSESGT